MATPTGDLERGNPEKDMTANAPAAVDDADIGEYDGLVRYISKYQDGRRGSAASIGGVEVEDDKPKKRHFWQAKPKDAGAGFETPGEWLETDMRRGLSEHDVLARRKKTGWNELTTEKENLFVKFLTFFTGPILYGTLIRQSWRATRIELARPLPSLPESWPNHTDVGSHGNRCPPRRWSARLDRFWCHHWHSDAQCRRRLVSRKTGRRRRGLPQRRHCHEVTGRS
jgi:hypothetical protein